MSVARVVWFGALLLGAGSCWALVNEAPSVTPTPVDTAAELVVQDAAVRAAAQQVATDYLAVLNAGE